MADELGSVSVTIKAEASQLEAGLAKARAETEKFDKAANKTAGNIGDAFAKSGAKTTSAIKQSNDAFRKQQSELAELLGKINPVVAALDRLDQQEAKLRKFKKAGLVDSATFVEYKKRIDESRKSLSSVDNSIRRTGDTSRQTAQALRQLPAQFSDIVISLQAGQSPFQVLLQQGSQIKDSFGGIGPAFRNTARFALGMVNPITVAAGALAVMGFAYKQGSDEATAFNNAIVLTGNVSGTSVGQLQNMASAIDQVNGTQRQAAQALALVANTGKFTSDQLQSIASAAVAMDEATGKAVSDTVAEFVRLADEPAKAAAKLNEQYHFLTASIHSQIAALEAQGDAAGAAQLAIDAFGQAMQTRAKRIEDNLGLIERAWKGIKNGAAEAWDEMLGIGRPQTPEERLEELSQQGKSFGKRVTQGLLSGFGPLGTVGGQVFDQANALMTDRNKEIGELWQEIQDRDEAAWVEGMNAQQQDNAIAAQQRIDDLKKSSLSNADKRNKALADLQKDLAAIRMVSPDDPRLDPANVAKLQANIADQFKDAKGPIDKTAEAMRKLKEQRIETIAEMQEEVRILGELSQQYIGSNMSAEQLATTGEILRTQAMLRVDANSAEGQSLDTLITKRNELQASIDEHTKKTKDAQDAFNDVMEEGRRVIESVRTPAEEYQSTIGKLNVLLEKGAINQETYNRAVANAKDEFDKAKEGAQEWSDSIGGIVTHAAENIQDELANFLFDPFAEGTKSMGERFSELLRKMAAEVAAAEIIKGLLGGIESLGGIGAGGDSGGGGAGIVGGLTSVAASLFHDGGTVGTDGKAVSVPASNFINAPRFHNGLKPDEFPSILQKGEEVVPKDKVGNRGGVTNINNWNINAPDPNAFRASQRQINRAAAARVQTR